MDYMKFITFFGDKLMSIITNFFIFLYMCLVCVSLSAQEEASGEELALVEIQTRNTCYNDRSDIAPVDQGHLETNPDFSNEGAEYKYIVIQSSLNGDWDSFYNWDVKNTPRIIRIFNSNRTEANITRSVKNLEERLYNDYCSASENVSSNHVCKADLISLSGTNLETRQYTMYQLRYFGCQQYLQCKMTREEYRTYMSYLKEPGNTYESYINSIIFPESCKNQNSDYF